MTSKKKLEKNLLDKIVKKLKMVNRLGKVPANEVC